MIKRILFVALATFSFASCLKDKTADISELPSEPTGPCVDTVSFTNVIMTEILDISCSTSGCHDEGSAASGYVFETYDQVNTNSAIILLALKHDPTITPTMPLGGEKVADSLIQKFECWIEQGKLNN